MRKHHPDAAHVRKHNWASEMTEQQRKEHEAALRRERNKRYRSKGKDDKVSVLLC
jgi:hypothetical protein